MKRFLLWFFPVFLLVSALVYFEYAVLRWKVGEPNDSLSYITREINIEKNDVLETAQRENITPNNFEYILFAFGDIMLGRNVEVKMNKYGENYPFEKLGKIFEGSSDVFANLEGPIPVKHEPTPSGSFQFSFDTRVASVLKNNGFTIVSLANNHTHDRGKANFENTQNILANSGISYFGHPLLSTEKYVYEKTFADKKIVFIGFNTVFASVFEKETALATVKEKAKDENTLVLVSIHWGEEYKMLHNTFQENLAHEIIDAGADIILGQHSHVVQDIENYKNKLIFYSFGNAVFDQYFSSETQEGLSTKIYFQNDNSYSVKLFPFDIVKSQIQFMEGEKKENWLKTWAKNNPTSLQENIESGKIEF